MASSDEPRDGDAPDGADSDGAISDDAPVASGDELLPPGPRRSTYTPPARATWPASSREPSPVTGEVHPPDDAPEASPVAPLLVAPLVGAPSVPERRSLSDAELTAGLTAELDDASERPGATLSAMEQLEEQLRLRQEEAEEYRDWEDTMVSLGTPEALAAVAKIRPQFQEVVAVTTSIPVQYPDAETATPPAAPEPPVTVLPQPPVAEPAAPPTPVDPPALIEPPAPAGAFTTGAVEAPESAPEPVADVPVFEEPVFEEPVFEQPVVEEAPEPASDDLPQETAAPEESDSDSGETAADEWAPEQPDELEQPELAQPELAQPADEAPAFDAFTFDVPAFDEPTPVDTSEPPADEDRDFDPFSDLPTPVDIPGTGPDLATLTFLEPSGPIDVVPSATFDDLLLGDPADFDPTAAAQPLIIPTSVPMPPAVALEPIVDEPALEPVEEVAPERVVETIAEPAPVAVVVAAPLDPPHPPFSPEEVGSLPTPEQSRVGRAVRLFWLWFASNSSVVSVALGAILFSLGMSLRQAVIATLLGVVLSFIPLGLGTLTGKRSGQPTMIVSRATFGVHGNIVPALLALVSRVFWGAALLWILGASIASLLVGANLNGGLGHTQLVILCMGIGFVVALVIAFFGYSVINVFQLVVSILSIVLVVGVIALTWSKVHLSTAVSSPDGPAALVVTGVVLVFSFVGLAWANSAGDLARYQRPGSSSGASMLWATFGTALPTFVLIAYGSLLAASDPAILAGLLSNPLDTLGRLLPQWYPVPLIAATALSLLSGVVVTIYSGSFAVAATGIRVKQTVSTLVVAVLVFVFGWIISTIGGDLVALFRDLATTVAVPIAAWTGIFAAETLLRRRRLHAPSLLVSGGIYPSVRWVNVGALVVITAIGYGLTTATRAGLGWQGYIFTLAGVDHATPFAASDVGVLVALVLGLLVPVAFGMRAIRRQESAELALTNPAL